MSGIVGGRNNRGSGLVANLGTDGQILTSAGAGLRQVFETPAGGSTVSSNAAMAKMSEDQTLADDTITKITFDTETWDTDGAFASNKFTVPADEGGKYLFILWCHVANTATDAASQNLFLYKNGAAVWQANCHFAANTIKRLLLPITWIDDASAADYFEGYANVSGTSPSVLGGTGSFGSFFGGYKLIGI